MIKMNFKLRLFQTTLIGLFTLTSLFLHAKEADLSFRIRTSCNISGIPEELKGWSIEDLSHLKKFSSREKDPITGKMIRWDGLLLSQLVDRGLETLPVERRAQVDLIILRNSQGVAAYLPRSFVSKYPVLLALSSSPSSFEIQGKSRGPVFSVIPWSSKPRILNEDLPLNSFFVSNINHIELGNYREKYRPYFLKRRTDPTAMKGEKFFVQNCVNCHSAAEKLNSVTNIFDTEKTKRFATSGHPPISNLKLNFADKIRKSIGRYFDAYYVENSVMFHQHVHSVQAHPLK